MRKVRRQQLQFGQADIGQIQFDPRSRDDIPQLLRGLQYIYTTPAVRAEVFRILEELAAQRANPGTGRPGLDLWKVLVMGTLRLNLNWDYDRLQNQVNYHSLIRQMLGHGPYDDEGQYKLQTLMDNVGLLTEEALARILATAALLRDLKETNLAEVARYAGHARRQMDQVRRRVLGGETIPHAEMVWTAAPTTGRTVSSGTWRWRWSRATSKSSGPFCSSGRRGRSGASRAALKRPERLDRAR